MLTHQRLIEHQGEQLLLLRNGKDPFNRGPDKLRARFHRMAAGTGINPGPRHRLQKGFRLEELATDVGNSDTGNGNVRPKTPRITCIAMTVKYVI